MEWNTYWQHSIIFNYPFSIINLLKTMSLKQPLFLFVLCTIFLASCLKVGIEPGENEPDPVDPDPDPVEEEFVPWKDFSFMSISSTSDRLPCWHSPWSYCQTIFYKSRARWDGYRCIQRWLSPGRYSGWGFDSEPYSPNWNRKIGQPPWDRELSFIFSAAYSMTCWSLVLEPCRHIKW